MTLSRDTLTRTTPSQTTTHLRGPSFRDTVDATSIHPQIQRTKLGGCTSQNKSPLSSFPNKYLFDSDNSRQRHSCFLIPSSLRGGRLRLVHPQSPKCVAIMNDVISARQEFSARGAGSGMHSPIADTSITSLGTTY